MTEDRSYFSHLEILKNLVLRNLRVRYRSSLLGFLWAFLNPFLTMVIFYLVFYKILKIEVRHYPLFLLAGLFPWSFFSSSLTNAASSLIDNTNLIKKVYFPREFLPLSYVLSNFINLLFSLGVFIPIVGIFRLQQLQFIYFLPLILIIHLVFTAGLSLFLSYANLYYRDIGHILEIALIFWFYLTPVFYPIAMVPEKLRALYLCNPMVPIIETYRNILFEGKPPDGVAIIIVTISVASVLFFAYFLFKRHEPFFAKEL